jgi:hypothetical protein
MVSSSNSLTGGQEKPKKDRNLLSLWDKNSQMKKLPDPAKVITQWEKKVLEKMYHLSQVKELEHQIEKRWGKPDVMDKNYLSMVFSDEYEALAKHVQKILQINRWLEKKKELPGS